MKSAIFARLIELLEGRSMLGDHADELRGRATEPEPRLLDIEPAGLNDIKSLSEQAREIRVLGVAYDPSFDAAYLPERGLDLTGRDPNPDAHRELEPEPAERNGLVFLGESAFAGLRFNPAGIVQDCNMRLDLVAVLPARTRRPPAGEGALLHQAFGIVACRVLRSLDGLIK